MIEFFHAVELDSQSGNPGSTQAVPHVVEELYIRKIDHYVLRDINVDAITFPPVKVLTVQGSRPDESRFPSFGDSVFDSLQPQSLTLKDYNIIELGGLAKNGRLANLRTFKTQGCVSKVGRQVDVSTMVHCLPPLFYQFRQLEELEMGCSQVVPMILDSICHNGGTLKKLNLSATESPIPGPPGLEGP